MIKLKFLILNIFIITNLVANDGFEDDYEDEFESEPIEIVQLEKEDKKEFIFNGSISLATSFNYAHDKPQVGQNDFRGYSIA